MGAILALAGRLEPVNRTAWKRLTGLGETCRRESGRRAG
jgi:hypothetical protein